MLHQYLVTYGPTVKVVGLFVLYILLMVALGHRSQIDAWCERNPRRAGVLKLIRGICPGDPWLIVQGLALLILKRLPMGYYRAAVNIVPPESAQAAVVPPPQFYPRTAPPTTSSPVSPPRDLPPAA